MEKVENNCQDRRNLLVRRLKYLSRRRATLELDVMLGRMADRLDWSVMSEPDLVDLTTILEMDEILLQKSLLSRGPAPRGANPDLWARILATLTP